MRSLTSYIVTRTDVCRCAYCNAAVGANARAFLDTESNRVYCTREHGKLDQADQIEEAARLEHAEREEFDMVHAGENWDGLS